MEPIRITPLELIVCVATGLLLWNLVKKLWFLIEELLYRIVDFIQDRRSRK